MKKIEGDIMINENDELEGIIYSFDICCLGWEYDSKGWIVEQNGNRFLVLTENKIFYKANKKELSRFIRDYENAIKRTQKALEMLQ